MDEGSFHSVEGVKMYSPRFEVFWHAEGKASQFICGILESALVKYRAPSMWNLQVLPMHGIWTR